MPTIPDVKPDPLGTDADLQYWMSTYGIRSWTNHTETDDPESATPDVAADTYENGMVLYGCKVYAGSFLASKLVRRYQYSDLDGSPLMIEIWCVIVLRTLCFRRGNPPPAALEFRYQELVQKDGLLDQILNGNMPLTDENGNQLRPKNANGPGWSNLQIDRWYPESKVRVVTGSSDMQPSALPRRTDRFPEQFS